MRPIEPLERYLQEWRDIYATGAGVPEESYYGPLLNLLNDIGGTLKPRVRCVGQLRNIGGGEPDFGLFTQEQVQHGEGASLPGQKPARGVVEVKAPEASLDDTLTSIQVLCYLRSYGLVLVTNYREFRLVGIAEGRQCELERFTLASDATAFQQLTIHPRVSATEQGEAFFEFLQRALLFHAPLSAPKDVAWFLASYAREARARVERADVPALDAVRQALEEALGIAFQGEKGAHFFRSTLVQTLFYGLFAAWVLWLQRGREGRFDWRRASGELHVPMIQVLFEQLSMTHRLRPLGLEEVLERAEALLNRVDAEAFFTQFSQEHTALAEAVAYLGDTTFDIYLNEVAYWRNVPSRVWSYTSGGYQVLKKWLSYREQSLLGRPLTHDEVLYVTNITRRIAALLLLEPALDEIYAKVKD